MADIFPLMGNQETAALAEDLKARGLIYPVILHKDGRILDGRNRYRACLRAGVEPKFETYDGDDPEGFVISANVRRGDRCEFKLAEAALNWVEKGKSIYSVHGTEKPGGRPKATRTRADAAPIFKVSVTTIDRVAGILEAVTEDEAMAALAEGARLEIIGVQYAYKLAHRPEDAERVIDKWLRAAIVAKLATPEQRSRWAKRRGARPKKEVDPVRKAKLMAVLRVAKPEEREFAYDWLWANFGPAVQDRKRREGRAPEDATPYPDWEEGNSDPN
jgi:hypothetical protein